MRPTQTYNIQIAMSIHRLLKPYQFGSNAEPNTLSFSFVIETTVELNRLKDDFTATKGHQTQDLHREKESP